MATYTTKSIESWQKFLTPLVTALVALCGAGAVYLKGNDNTKVVEERTIERVVKLESKVDNLSYRTIKLERDADLLKATLADMKSDLSFIRGKLEGKGK